MSAFQTKSIEECVKVQVELCGEAKQKVVDRQADYFRLTGKCLSKKLAIVKIILGK